MVRARLGVVALVPPPLEREVDAFRLALADPARARIPAHVTLVPPVNVELARVPEALGLLRRAASGGRPFDLELGPVASFAPESPTLYLACGAGSDALATLRAALWSAPLARAVERAYVPHVTLCEQASSGQLAAGPVALAGYRSSVRLERIHLLRQGDDRSWRPVADAWLGAGGVIGRGGLEVELTYAGLADPEVRGWCARWDEGPAARDEGGRLSGRAGGLGRTGVHDGGRSATAAGAEDSAGSVGSRSATVWVVARREGRVVGVASGRLDATGALEALDGDRATVRTVPDGEVTAVLEWLGVARDARRQGIGGLLVGGFLDAARRAGAGAARAGRGLPGEVETLCRAGGVALADRSSA